MTVIIAEAGVNHNGSEKLAFELVDAAFNAGVDIIKFQTFKAKALATKEAKQADYQVINTGKKESQLAMLSRLELSYECHHKLIEYCNKLGIEFLSSAFDVESLNFLAHDLGLKKLKIASGELTNAPLLLDHAKTGVDLIVSTGMATLSEVELALGVIAFGYLAETNLTPSVEAFQVAYLSQEGQSLLHNKVTLLHCTTEYPAPISSVNLKAMDTLSQAFKLKVGYSDHSVGITVPIAAVARGAQVLEKHFTLDKKMKGPDHQASLNPSELGEMVNVIRQTEQVIGNGIKGPHPCELKNRLVARKCIVASSDITKGDLLTSENLSIKRAGNGLTPYKYWALLGSRCDRDYLEGDLINE